MKIALIQLFGLFCPALIFAQQNCLGGNEVSRIFQTNHVSASFSPQGNKFLPLRGYLKAPYTSENCAYTIFASSPWIGGFLNGQLGVSAQRYAGYNFQDLYSGPLQENALPLGSDCYRYNKIWSVGKEDILHHIEDFESDGMISDTLLSVFGWPSTGNNFFAEINGFELLPDHAGGWADFFDRNQNGNYEPELGEYPCIILRGQPYIPDEIFWMVFNDQGPHTYSNGLPLGVEVQVTVFGFNCTDNTLLNYTIFNTYKVINQNSVNLDSVFFGMWTDYDLGCIEDDYHGCDTTRNCEFVYNRDPLDGDVGIECTADVSTYGSHPPVQSYTYLSHKMTSYISAPWVPQFPYFPQEYYNFLNGHWRDGTQITVHGNGYNPGSSYPTTRYLFFGDPQDSSQWSLNSYRPTVSEPSTLSAAYLGQLKPYESEKIETVYMFHQDSSLDNIQQVGFMQYQIDSLIKLLDEGQWSCKPFPYCEDLDCVWPGDFNHNGIADHFDLLYWGVMKDSTGSRRDGKINWEGHFADPWSLELPDGFNAKHGDGNGDGKVDMEDLDRNLIHFLYTTPFYTANDQYPPGPHLRISADPLNEMGELRNFKISVEAEIDNVLGIAYELEYDTSLFDIPLLLEYFPSEVSAISYLGDTYGVYTSYDINDRTKLAYVYSDHQERSIPQGSIFQKSLSHRYVHLKPGITPEQIPDSMIFRLKNLIAIDAEGNDLHIGSNPLIVYKQDIVGITDPGHVPPEIYPNPSIGQITIITDHPSDIEVIDLHGRRQRIISGEEATHPVSLEGLPQGVYFLRFLESGEVLKLLIQ